MFRIILIISFIGSHVICSSQCIDQLVLEKNQDLQDFFTNYPDCNYVGNLTINGAFDNISDLEVLDSVDMLTIHNSQIDSLIVESFFGIKYRLQVNNNENLKYVNVHFIPSEIPTASIVIENNIDLDSFILDANEIKFLTVNNQNQSDLRFNAEQINLEGIIIFNSCTFSGQKPKVLTQLEFYGDDDYTSLRNIQDKFDISNIEFIHIGYKPKFSSSGVSFIQNLNSLKFIGIDSLNIDDFVNWDYNLNRLNLNDCKYLNDLSPFQNVTISNLSINNLPLLNSLQGLNFPDTLDGISLANNALLTDISSLESVDTIIGREGLYDIRIEGNENLSWCSYKAICDRNYVEDEKVVIRNNNGACENNESVNTFCLSNTEEYENNTLKLFPNPVSSDLYVEGNSEEIKSIEIFDITGEILMSLNDYNERIALSEFVPGVYILKITSKGLSSSNHLITKL